ncbi:transcriptional regulator with XRE-family HTH domain [Rhizobium petrolearium]|uniref:Helix-turn-helix transcriptional regulator n=2 Tax=Neorhizobium TaxID=1525371 RepID=A0ABV0MCH5_9HYPH|nr:helix-turn-helix transcriptional regulator [Neorhizobium petrolearium]MBP1848315.1 transcriptional regulator with XRE-family HTH domain [Neorhizobium petrolearium]MCC2614535.1 helix-turn-helix domain-containing protein [Neorhizobium petrolearium]WGI72294.1 helix-turn-helix transcriptional regulator [Neorhizobium petrolearium]
MANTLETKVLRNMALAMEREREKRGMTVTELARLCELTESDYLGILDGSVNLRLSAIDRISNNLRIHLDELIGGQSRKLSLS